MAKFNFSRLAVDATRTARFVMHQVAINGKTPYLVMRPATEATKAYYNAVLKRAGKSVKQVQAGAINAGMLSDNRDDDRRLYPQHIVTDWGYIKEDRSEVPGMMPDEDGNDTPFSRENCAEFLQALPDWLFDEARQFAGNTLNFVEDGEDPVDPEAMAGN